MSKFNRLFIAEKPSAAQSLADHLAKAAGIQVAKRPGGVLEVGNDIVIGMRGHLLSQVPPDVYNPAFKSWDAAHLPIIPAPFQLEVQRVDKKSREADPQTAAKVETIRQLLSECTSVVGFGDPDNEGQLLQDELLLFLKNTKPVERLWANAMDTTTLTRALASMRPNSEYVGKYEAALARSEADWLYGINMTRACTVFARAAGGDSVVSIGRVQTPTLSLVVTRENEIRNFVAVKFHVPFVEVASAPDFKATWSVPKSEDGTYADARVDAEGRITRKSDSDAIVAACKGAGEATVTRADTTPGTENAPLPFALSSLQMHCSRLFGLTAVRTLEVAQSLYEKKLTSYPRVDCDYLPVSQHADGPRILASLTKGDIPAALAQAITGADSSLKSRAWDDSKVTAHHAIIPCHLDKPGDVAALSDIEGKLYFEIVKRYVLQFYPAAKFNTTSVELTVAGETFSISGRGYTFEGWRKAFSLDAEDGAEESKSPKLPSLEVGQVVTLSSAGAESKSTKAPKRFDDGTLIAAMKGIHAYVTNPELKKRLKASVGIGTEATRANIIEGLMARGYLVTEKKCLVPTENAMSFIGSLPAEMTVPDMTAVWQSLTDDVENRKSTHAEFISKMGPWLTKLVVKSPTFFKPGQFKSTKPAREGAAKFEVTEHKCFGEVEKPGCGSGLKRIEGKFGSFFGCSNEACKKNFRDVDGKPVERTPGGSKPADVDKTHSCAQCKHPELGYMRRIERKDKSGYFWGCGNWRAGCQAVANDEDGKPVYKVRQPAKA